MLIVAVPVWPEPVAVIVTLAGLGIDDGAV
jgi:hypothetical protein